MFSRTLLRTVPVLALAALVVSCERLDVGPEIAGELSRARDAASTLVALAADSSASEAADDADIIALLYLERQRLGLGSPFRLIDYALSDPRLDSASRRRVGWMLLARTLDGDGHAVDVAAVDYMATKAQLSTEAGARHVRIIERAVTEARDPRAGEQAVRIAYAMAAAEGAVSQWSPVIAARSAALVRDREIARSDARTLLRAARRQGSDPLALVSFWRSARRFQVERPPMEGLDGDAEREALEIVPRLRSTIRTAADALVTAAVDTVAPADTTAAPADTTAGAIDTPPPAAYAISRTAAKRMVAVTQELKLPPQAPIVVSVSGHRSRLMERRELDTGGRRARVRFIDRVTNEETFVAEYSVLRQDVSAPAGAPALTALAAAVSMRAFAQEEPWWPGTPAPAARDIRERFGLAALTFDPDVPDEWKGYYTRKLLFALADLQRVMPALKLRGLSLHLGESPMRSEALAMHDPRARVIYLPLATAAGTLAHEVAHDLDWQVARTRYGTRGEYASDRAIRDQDGSPLAQSLQGLTSATLIPPLRQNNHRPPHDHRPAEVFARSVDWFVAVALSREGRSNGFLSSVQDDVLTGYVTVAPPDVTGAAGEALVRILDDLAPVTAVSRDWFLAQYGTSRPQGPHDLTRKVLEHPVPSEGASLRHQLAAVSAARERALQAVDAEVCRSGGSFDDRRLAAARTRVVMLAAESRARGLISAAFEVRLRDDAERYATQRAIIGAAGPLAPFNPLPTDLVQSMLEQARLLEQVQTPIVLPPRSRERCAAPAPRRTGGRLAA